MARGYHKTIIKGNLGKDPEVKHFDSGNSVASFSVAVSDSFKNKDGEFVEQTEWYNVVVWGKLTEVVEKYLSKGDSVLIEGRMKTRSYDDKNGDKRYVTELNATEINMLGGKPEGESRDANVSKRDANVANRDANEGVDQEDDLPF